MRRPRTGPVSRRLALGAPAVIALSLGLLSMAAAQTPRTSDRAVLLPGCALPPAKLIAAAAPIDVTLRLAVASTGEVVDAEMRRGTGHPELDAAFATAAKACRFAPVPAGGQRVEHKLTYRYSGGPQPLGVHACFPTEYPSRARRRDEEGTTIVSFRVPAGDATPPEVGLARSSGSGSLDAEALLRASSCLSNGSVRAELVPDQWYQQSVRWVLQ